MYNNFRNNICIKFKKNPIQGILATDYQYVFRGGGECFVALFIYAPLFKKFFGFEERMEMSSHYFSHYVVF